MTKDEFLELKKKHSHKNQYKVKNKDELKELIKIAESIDVHMDLNWLDVSSVEDMSYLFKDSKFNGNISDWDVSNVKNMKAMFMNSEFNGDISDWDVSNVTDMSALFMRSKFNGDISDWDVSNVESMCCMFQNSKFNGDISDWDVSNVESMCCMFEKSKFDRDISDWDVDNIKNAIDFNPYLDITNTSDLQSYIVFLRSIYNNKPIEVYTKDGWFKTRNLSVFIANKIRKYPNFVNKIRKALC